MIRHLVLVAALLAAAAPAAAAHRYLPPLSGLVPNGFALTESPAPWLPEQLGAKSLAVVVSGNLDVSIADWRKQYGRAAPGSAQETIGKAIDPAPFVRRLIAQLRPRFGTMAVVPDIAAARRQNADYIAVIDYDMGFRTQMLKTYQVFHGGVLMLDGQVRRVFTVDAESEVRSNDPNMFKLDFGSVSAEDTTAAFTRMADEVAAGLDTRLK